MTKQNSKNLFEWHQKMYKKLLITLQDIQSIEGIKVTLIETERELNCLNVLIRTSLVYPLGKNSPKYSLQKCIIKVYGHCGSNFRMITF